MSPNCAAPPLDSGLLFRSGVTIARCKRSFLPVLLALASLLAAGVAQASPDLLPPPEPVALPVLDRVAMYEEQSKNPLGALAWEIIPGAGSLYADDARGAALTWAMMLVGTAAAVWGASHLDLGLADSSDPNYPRYESVAGPTLLSGLALMCAGRIYGFANAVGASNSYNAVLRAQLALPPDPDRPR